MSAEFDDRITLILWCICFHSLFLSRTHTYIHTYIHKCIYNTHTYLYTYIHTYIPTYMYIIAKTFESFITLYAYAEIFDWWSSAGHETKQYMQLSWYSHKDMELDDHDSLPGRAEIFPSITMFRPVLQPIFLQSNLYKELFTWSKIAWAWKCKEL